MAISSLSVNGRALQSTLDAIEARGPRLWLAATPLLFGLFSVLLGQDANWDLRNYHLYNPWAFVGGRIDIDLAAAGLPSYFNPLLDLPYYWMSGTLPPRLVAFVMGAWHGLAFPLLWIIARRSLPIGTRPRVFMLLAFAGCTASTFLSEFGNTMGDDSTAPLMLAAVALVLRPIDHRSVTAMKRRTPIFIAGLACGLGIGLKLTNAPFGLGLLAGIAAGGGTGSVRDGRTAIAAAGMGIGFAATGGFWLMRMWSHFANPFFPQFNGFFASPLAAAMSIDDRWLPHGFVEGVLYPYVFTVFPMRVNEIPVIQFLWPIAYTVLLILTAMRIVRHARHRADRSSSEPPPVSPHDRFLVAFSIVGFVAWMLVFGVERYLVVLELLLPLLTWKLLHRVFREPAAGRLSVLVLAAASTLAIARFETWGTARWGEAAFTVDAPPIADPSRTTILVLTAPVAWMFPHYPSGLAYLSLDGTFPESPAYHRRVRETIAARGGPALALIAAARYLPDSRLVRLNRWLDLHRVGQSDLLCRLARMTFDHAPSTDIVADRRTASCRFERDNDRYHADEASDRAIAIRTSKSLATTGYVIDVDRCIRMSAFIGAEPFPYQLCPLVRP